LYPTAILPQWYFIAVSLVNLLAVSISWLDGTVTLIFINTELLHFSAVKLLYICCLLSFYDTVLSTCGAWWA
jgi:hypothetical protein